MKEKKLYENNFEFTKVRFNWKFYEYYFYGLK